jgi:hypothetical protein
MLGLNPDAPRGELRIDEPKLPRWLNEVTVENLRVGKGAVSLKFIRDGDQTECVVLANNSGLKVT